MRAKKPNGYWTYEKCYEEALKYETKTIFQKNSSGSYYAALKNKWLYDICSHMKIQGNNFLRFVYIFEFEDRSAYIGLTYNIKEREIKHVNDDKSKVYKHIKEKCKKYILKQLNEKPILGEEAQQLEHEIKLKYMEEGWNILNKGATGKGVGSLGGNTLKWTKERCQKEALKYKTKLEFELGSKSIYNSAIRYKWLHEICSHMIEIRKQNNYWTKERCQKEALKYNSRDKFHKNSSGSYDYAFKNKWLNEICSHMIDGRTLVVKKWNYETCKQEALKYKTKAEFKLNSVSSYNTAIKNKWINEICFHMIEIQKPSGYWNNYKTCKQEALKYNSRDKFHKKSSSAYKSSLKNKWLDEFFPKKKKIDQSSP